MKKASILATITLALSLLLMWGFAAADDAPLDAKKLREMLGQLGHTVKDLNTEVGKEKYSVDFKTESLNIPLGFEISPSKSFVWMTVNLGPAPKTGDDMTLQLLKQNAKVQPTFFYITDGGSLMAAMAIDNRAISNAVLKARSEKITADVDKTRSVWQKS
ncbi:MAG: hypothetical protein JNJ45_05100 [Chthonomonas sp.]|nr:hypothetical protein [Chthonomonas sp.]